MNDNKALEKDTQGKNLNTHRETCLSVNFLPQMPQNTFMFSMILKNNTSTIEHSSTAFLIEEHCVLCEK